MNELRYKRIYETPVEADGFRVLVDKLWPRGMKKENAKIELWAKEIAPSDTDRNCPRTQHPRSLKICVCRSCKIIT